MTESAVLKRVLHQALFSDHERVGASVSKTTAPRSARLYVRLASLDRELLRARAEGRALPEATYAALLLRAFLRKASPLPAPELAALNRSISELSAVGRHLRHLIRLTEVGAPSGTFTTSHAQTMLTVCDALRRNTKSLLEANAESWGQGGDRV